MIETFYKVINNNFFKRLSSLTVIQRKNFLISQTEEIDYNNSYKATKLKIALVLLSVTSIWVNELLSLEYASLKRYLQNIKFKEIVQN